MRINACQKVSPYHQALTLYKLAARHPHYLPFLIRVPQSLDKKKEKNLLSNFLTLVVLFGAHGGKNVKVGELMEHDQRSQKMIRNLLEASSVSFIKFSAYSLLIKHFIFE
jgi:hypothetical protein